MIYIFMEGGCLTAVCSDTEQEYAVIDYDTESYDENSMLFEIPQEPNSGVQFPPELAYVYKSKADSPSGMYAPMKETIDRIVNGEVSPVDLES